MKPSKFPNRTLIKKTLRVVRNAKTKRSHAFHSTVGYAHNLQLQTRFRYSKKAWQSAVVVLRLLNVTPSTRLSSRLKKAFYKLKAH